MGFFVLFCFKIGSNLRDKGSPSGKGSRWIKLCTKFSPVSLRSRHLWICMFRSESLGCKFFYPGGESCFLLISGKAHLEGLC